MCVRTDRVQARLAIKASNEHSMINCIVMTTGPFGGTGSLYCRLVVAILK